MKLMGLHAKVLEAAVGLHFLLIIKLFNESSNLKLANRIKTLKADERFRLVDTYSLRRVSFSWVV